MPKQWIKYWSDPGKSPGLFVSVCLAIASVAVATALTFPLATVATHSRSLFLIVAVMFCAWCCGAWSGVSAAVLSVLVFDYYFDQTPGVFDVTPAGVIRAVVFMAAALFVTYLTAQRNQALRDALHANEALQKANETDSR